MSARDRDRGSASIWVVAACSLLLLVGGVVTIRTSAVVARHRAEAAADLAALAAAGRIGVGGDPCAAAGRIAAANGATVQSCRPSVDQVGRSGTVVVIVRVVAQLPVLGAQSVTAGARAARLEADEISVR